MLLKSNFESSNFIDNLLLFKGNILVSWCWDLPKYLIKLIVKFNLLYLLRKTSLTRFYIKHDTRKREIPSGKRLKILHMLSIFNPTLFFHFFQNHTNWNGSNISWLRSHAEKKMVMAVGIISISLSFSSFIGLFHAAVNVSSCDIFQNLRLHFERKYSLLMIHGDIKNPLNGKSIESSF